MREKNVVSIKNSPSVTKKSKTGFNIAIKVLPDLFGVSYLVVCHKQIIILMHYITQK